MIVLLVMLTAPAVALLDVPAALGAGTLEDRIFHSAALGVDKHVMIYLPDGYSLGNYAYPVVYYLHGAFSDYNSDSGLIKSTLDTEIGSGRIRPLIVAMPSGSAGAFGGSMWANSDLYGRFEDYLETDVRQFVETNYRAISDRSERSIIGFSMGGMGSFNSAFRHAELYCAAVSHSGGLDYQHMLDFAPLIIQEAGGGPGPYTYDPGNGLFTDLFFLVAGAWSPNLARPPFQVDFPLDPYGAVVDSVYYGKWMPNGPQRLARRLLSGPNLAIYFDCGTADDLHLYPFNTAFAETLTTLGIPHRFRTIPGGHHTITAPALAISFGFADSVMRRGSASSVEHGSQKLNASDLRIRPTPSRGPVTLSFRLNQRGWVTLDILDVSGRRVARLIDGVLGDGMHEVTWVGGRAVRSGVYLARLTTTSGSGSTRIVLTR